MKLSIFLEFSLMFTKYIQIESVNFVLIAEEPKYQIINLPRVNMLVAEWRLKSTLGEEELRWQSSKGILCLPHPINIAR